ncbi:14012_t:CDS:2, partial [Racocetra fulgida]
AQGSKKIDSYFHNTVQETDSSNIQETTTHISTIQEITNQLITVQETATYSITNQEIDTLIHESTFFANDKRTEFWGLQNEQPLYPKH